MVAAGAGAGATLNLNLTQYEPHFLARALRGIASALEEGEAAAGGGARSRRSSRASSVASGSSQGQGHRRGTSSSASASASASASGSPGSNSNSSGSSTGGSPTAQHTSPRRSTSIYGGSGASFDPEDDFYAPDAAANATAGTPPDAATPLLDAVQASALLAVYFFGKARLLEGYYHVSAAARLAVALGLHQIRERRWKAPGASVELGAGEEVPSGFAFREQQFQSNSWSATAGGAGGAGGGASTGAFSGGDRWSGSSSSSSSSSSGAGAGAGTVHLPPALSALAHAERVAAFWSVFSADRVWAVATGLPSSLPDDAHPQLRIESVWPWDEESGVVSLYFSLGTRSGD